nr:retrovirus-related Pol polyprotein from transposon TNT 1-94 [Tanacetum cinerariifolium]
MRPFGCPVTILNTLDPLDKFQGKVDEGFLVGYSVCSKAFRVFNSRTRIVQETLHVNFMENKPNIVGSGPAWLFNIDSLTRTMNYHPVIAENQTNSNAGFQDTEKAGEEGTQTYMLFPMLSDGSTNSQNNNKDALVDGKEHDDDIQMSVSPDIHFSSSGAQSRKQGDKIENKDKGKSPVVTITGFKDLNAEFKECTNNSSNGVNAASSPVSTAGHNFINNTNDFSVAGPSNADMPNVEDLTHSNDADDVGAEADINNLESIISVSPIPTTRIHKDHPTSQIIGDLSSTTQTRSVARVVRDQGSGPAWLFDIDSLSKTMNYHLVIAENQTNSNAGFQDTKRAGEEGTQTYVLFPVLSNGSTNSQNNNKDALVDGKEHDDDIQKSVSLDIHSSSSGTQTKKQGDKTENKDKVSPIPTTRIHKDHPTFQIIGDLSSTTQTRSMARAVRDQEEEVYVCQPPGFEDPENPDKVYKVVKALYRLHQAPRA